MEKTHFGNTEVHLTVLCSDAANHLNTELVTSCFVLAFNEEQELCVTVNPRGLDFVGGHVEDNETPYETMVREAKEEASIDVNDHILIGAIKVFHPNWNESIKYPETGYQLFYLSKDFDVKEFDDSFECSERDFVTIDEFKKRHHNLLDSHKEILEIALDSLKNSLF